MKKREPLVFLGTFAALVILLALWESASLLVARPFLPDPWRTALRTVERMADGKLLAHLGASARRVFLALAISGPAGFASGLAAGRSRRVDALFSPFVYILHPLPKVAFLPVIMLLLGLGDASKVALICLVIFGQLFVNARDAARDVPPKLVDSVLSMGATRLDLLRHVIFPATMPALLSSMRVALGTSFAVLFLSETFASESGLGWFIVDAWSRVDYPDMYAAIVTLSAFALSVFWLIDVLERRACAWRDVD